MRQWCLIKTLVLIMLCFSISASALGQKGDGSKAEQKPLTPEELARMDKGKFRPPSGQGFYIGPIDGTPGRYTILLTAQTQAVTESYLINQLALIQAVLVEAKKFAQTDEGVGTGKPLTTRFSDKKEPSFMVDVSKVGLLSKFYITLKGHAGKLTIEAGTIKRNDPNSKALFYDIIDQVQTVLSSQ